MDKYFSSWEIHTTGISTLIESALAAREIKESDIVWRGPSGDAIVASDPAELGEEYAEYTDAGQVDKYLI